MKTISPNIYYGHLFCITALVMSVWCAYHGPREYIVGYMLMAGFGEVLTIIAGSMSE